MNLTRLLIANPWPVVSVVLLAARSVSPRAAGPIALSARLSARLSGANEVPPVTGAASDSAETSLNPSNPVRTWIHAAAHPGAEICGQVTLRQ